MNPLASQFSVPFCAPDFALAEHRGETDLGPEALRCDIVGHVNIASLTMYFSIPVSFRCARGSRASQNNKFG